MNCTKAMQDAIESIVAEMGQVSRANLRSRSRKAELVFARSLVWCYMYTRLDVSSTKLSELYGYNNNTVLHTIEKLNQRVRYEPRIKACRDSTYEAIDKALNLVSV